MSGPPLSIQVISSLRWNAAAKFGGQLINWAITLVVLRLLLPSDYGLMAMANVVIGLLSMVAEMGFGASLIQSSTLERVRIRQVWGAALLLNTSICAGLMLVAPLIAAFYGEPRLVAVIRTASLGFVIGAVALVPDAMLRKRLQYKVLSILDLATGLIGSLSTLTLALAGQGVWALVLGPLGAGLLRAILLHAIERIGFLPSISFQGARSLISFGAALTATRILWYIFSQIDVLIAGKMLGKESVGLYSVAVHLATLPMQRALSVINDVAFSAFARIQRDRYAVATNLRLAVRLTAFFAFPTLWGLALVAPQIVHIAMGSKWLDAIVPLQIIASTIPLRMVGTVVSTAVLSVGRVDISMVTTAIAAVLAPPLFIFASRYGIVGMSLAWLLLMPIVFALNLFRSLPLLGVSIREILAELVRPVLCAIAMAICVTLAGRHMNFLSQTAHLIFSIGLGVGVYSAATLLINRAGATEAVHVLFPGRFVSGTS